MSAESARRSGGNVIPRRLRIKPLRKVTKNRGHFPNDDAVVKLLWLAICNIEDKRARAREKEKGGSRETKRKAEGRLVEGQITTN